MYIILHESIEPVTIIMESETCNQFFLTCFNYDVDMNTTLVYNNWSEFSPIEMLQRGLKICL